jgi:hypothetical protein
VVVEPAAGAAVAVPAGGAPLAATEPPGPFHELLDALTGGEVRLDLRLRAEIVEEDELDTSQAYTSRLRLGYGSAPWHGLSVYAEMEDIRSADEDLYNAAGLNGEPDKAVVADPEDTELNQFYAKYHHDYFGLIAGRQRITLDDRRFVGNVGWRQNEQTYDAYTVTSEWIEDLALFYSYLDDVNRIFGPDARRDFESNSHLLHASYAGLPAGLGRLTAFGYFLDFPNADASSSSTGGLRVEGSRPLGEDFSLGHILSYAYQADAADNADDYGVHYYFIEGSLSKKGLGALGAGYEVLGSDDGEAAFQTPLATGHRFNGWADVFLTTPDDGLEDLYVFASATLFWKIRTDVYYHWFFSDEGSSDFGNEIDAVASKAITKNLSVLAKLAVFDGDGLPDVQKYWLQTELTF